MKKILFLSLITLLMAGCSKDDETKLTLDTSDISLYSEDTKQVTASEKVTWSVDDEFVASIGDNGLVKGKHVGKATITATGSNGQAMCGIEVKAKYNTFIEPVLEFGASKSTIKSKEKRTLNIEEGDNLLFEPDNSAIKGVVYIFENGKMVSAGVYVKTANSLEATNFLIERYQVVGTGSGNIVGLMLNNLPNKANMSIAMSVKSNYVLVMYMIYDKANKASKAIDDNTIINKMKELYKNIE